MKFFVPGTSIDQTEATYEALGKAAHDQLRTAITPRRIYSLRYTHDKHRITVRVGETHPDHPGYTILAILESQPHILLTQAANGKPGPTIMVSTLEITEVIEFTDL